MPNAQLNSIATVIEQQLDRSLDDTTRQSRLTDLGLDSLDFFELVMSLEEVLGITINVDELNDSMTINDLITIIYQQLNPSDALPPSESQPTD